MEQDKKELLAGTQRVLNTIEKVKNNPNDAKHGKKEIDIYWSLTDNEIKELQSLDFTVTYDAEPALPTGIYHTISWK